MTRDPSTDDALLADLFRRALKAEIIDVGMHLQPSYRLTIRPGVDFSNEIELTDPEVEALRRSV